MWHGGRGLFTSISRMVSVSHPSRVALWSMRTVVDDLIMVISMLSVLLHATGIAWFGCPLTVPGIGRLPPATALYLNHTIL